jgi:hypothetical protein
VIDSRIARLDRLAVVAGPLLVVALIAWLAGWTGPDRAYAALDVAWILLTSLPLAVAWMIAALGFGWPLRRLLLPETTEGPIIQLGLGVAALLWLDASLGSLGWLQLGGWVGGSVVAWVVLAGGFLLLAVQLRGSLNRRTQPLPAPPWLVWTAAPAVAVLLLAACSAPGWLWASEFGGYDALSYHLQLPKEWLASGRIEPLSHNVYSFFPGYMEGAYYHLAVLTGDAIAAVYACQLLHACLTLAGAAALARLAARVASGLGAVAAVVMLGTPWVIVVGSLAYNEAAAALFLATGLLVIIERPPEGWRAGAAVGALAGAACGVKLTAVGFVAAPLGLLMVMRGSVRGWPVLILSAAGAGIVCLLPYLLRNAIHAGNPVFPFATGLLGLGHWTPQQAEIWHNAHFSGGGVFGRLPETWNQLLRYGLGSNPDSSEPWAPQWSILPWLTGIALLAGATSPKYRRLCGQLAVVLLAQLLFWLLFTHLKSRFMLPAVIPATLAVTVGGAVVAERLRGRVPAAPAIVGVGLALLIWSCVPVLVYSNEPYSNHSRTDQPDAPSQNVGLARWKTGDALDPDLRRELAEYSPTIMINHGLEEGARVLLVGEAAPFYYRADVVYQTTWDRGPLSEAMRAQTDDPAAWLESLRRRGFTHLLVEPTMLLLWQREGWNDPLITAERVLDAADRFAELVVVFPNGARLYRMVETSSVTEGGRSANSQ